MQYHIQEMRLSVMVCSKEALISVVNIPLSQFAMVLQDFEEKLVQSARNLQSLSKFFLERLH